MLKKVVTGLSPTVLLAGAAEAADTPVSDPRVLAHLDITTGQMPENLDVVRLIAPHLDAEAETRRIVEREERDFDGLTATPGAARLLGTLPRDA
ncbi:hypothetical protein [Streptantibioticus ferralitis]|uniref:Uncharacterized protein n=1 Tax=Streptantibioticus ferralitis TaxID=236510 RepID=A0ABT5YW66_9ACTN|nr:hypothetical protein [Streptantibioticus ferralitis]MDF2255847.1 hypothetical protein [Streptantibioticus ferralitis]